MTPGVPDKISLFDEPSATGCAFGTLCREPTGNNVTLKMYWNIIPITGLLTSTTYEGGWHEFQVPEAYS